MCDNLKKSYPELYEQIFHTEEIRHITLSEINQLKKLHDEAKYDKHDCKWENVFMYYPPHLLNAQPYRICRVCGAIEDLKLNDDIREQIHKVKSNKFNKSEQS